MRRLRGFGEPPATNVDICRPGRRISPDAFKALTRKFGLTQEQAGAFFGGSGRSGQRWSALGPPPAVAMLAYLMDFLDMLPDEVESVLCERTGAPRILRD